MTRSTTNIMRLHFRNASKCALQVSGNTLQQVRNFKYLAIVLTSDSRRNKEIYSRIGNANTVLPSELISATRELLNTAKRLYFIALYSQNGSFQTAQSFWAL